MPTPAPDHRAVPPKTHYRGRTMVKAARVPGIAPGTVNPRTYPALHVNPRTYPALHALRPALRERGLEP
ncbi:hypothetical protein OG937_01295 [Streptomyces sp. NBC_00510]